MTITAQFREDASAPAWFNINDSGYITGFSDVYMGLSKKETKLKIPTEINGKTVYGIAEGAFASNYYLNVVGLPQNSEAVNAANAEIASVSFPATAISIKKCAFAGCKKLYSVDLRNISRLEEAAFIECGTLMEIDLSKVTYIGNQCFNSCSLLSNIDLSSCSGK